MEEENVIRILKEDLNFDEKSLYKLRLFCNHLILANQKHNLISKNTESNVWHRHVLDSAQLVKFIDFKKGSLADLGSGAGFPGIVLAIYNTNDDFHVKLYEKSPVKRAFLKKIVKELDLKANILSNINDEVLDAEIIVCRAFKKLDKIIQVSREIAKNPHKLIVLKGRSAQKELNKAFKNKKYAYKLEKSITDKESRIIIINF